MLRTAFGALAAAVLLGVVLVVLHGSRRLRAAPVLGALHGVLGAAGLALLVVVVAEGTHQAAVGTAGFGAAACVLLGLGLLMGLVVWRLRVRRADPLLAIGIHASLAIFGFVLLAAYMASPA